MRIFLSYAWQDREHAKSVYLALRDQGHRVFFDRADLPAGDEYHNRIRQAIEDSHLLIFLASPLALDAGSYTLTELDIAEKSGRKLLPVVVVGETDFAKLPPALKAVTVLRTDGNVAASVAAEVHRIASVRKRRWLKQAAAALCLSVLLLGGIFYGVDRRGKAEIVGKDGAPAVLIPAGNFVMGDDENSPRREIYLAGFYMDRYEVTVGRYAKFLEATGALKKPDGWPDSDLEKLGEFAVVGVDWHDANNYCRWAGKRLPTEAEWEKAARGGDGRTYPWGSAEPTTAHARFGVSGSKAVYPDGISHVGKYPQGMGPFGMHDLAGNASEWVADWYAPGFSRAQVQNPKGPDTGTSKVVRGGGWMDPAERITTTKRMYLSPDERMEDIGFRCAADLK
jgi:formylglycine-generating enzyme required for sulfatase activity